MIRVLVVDDDFMVARVHRGMVEQVPGFTVVGEAYSGAEALTAVAELAPDLVLLDVYLPDMNGLDVLRELRGGHLPAVDVLAVTAARDAATIQQAMRGGVVHYLIKPFAFEALRDRLLRYAEARRRLNDAVHIGQSDVDRVFGMLRPARPELPKGLNLTTAELVERVLREAPGDLSAAECGEAAGLSRVSARRYLEHFVETGKVEVRLRYGATGRPERRYRWTAAGA